MLPVLQLYCRCTAPVLQLYCSCAIKWLGYQPLYSAVCWSTWLAGAQQTCANICTYGSLSGSFGAMQELSFAAAAVATAATAAATLCCMQTMTGPAPIDWAHHTLAVAVSGTLVSVTFRYIAFSTQVPLGGCMHWHWHWRSTSSCSSAWKQSQLPVPLSNSKGLPLEKACV